MTKRLWAALAFCLSIAAAAAAQDRIAVLDTVLPKGIDTGVVIPVTEKIMEEFVRSKLFIVLDRSFINKTLSEQEFSASDLTSGDSAALATIGGFLKANYIIVSTVQKLDTRLFLSAKMIEVKSGVIVAQSSVDRDGSISILIDMAGELGRKLVAASMGKEVADEKAKPAAPAKPTQATPPTASEPPAQAASRRDERKAEQKAKSKRFGTVSGDFGTGLVGDTSGLSYGVSAMIPLGLFYVSGGASVISADTDSTYVSGYGYLFDRFTDLDLFAGAGLDIMVGPVIVYAGLRAAFTAVDDSIVDEDGDSASWASYAGATFGLEVGADLRLGAFSVGARFSSLSGELQNNDDDSYSTLTNGTLMLRVGYAF